MKLYQGNCLEVMQDIPDNSIDFILTDLPYGTTACKWDNIIPYDSMWKELKRIRKDNTAIALFGTEPFSSHLRLSNLKEFKYDLIWKKNIPTGFYNAKKQQLKIYEIISLFYKKQPTYNPQMVKRTDEEYKKSLRINDSECFNPDVYGSGRKKLIRKTAEQQKYKYPFNILEYKKERNYGKNKHPTQKPVALLEYLIKTYTLENETVLDFTMGSGSTGVAAINTNRDFIGIELDKEYYNIAKERIDEKLYNNTS
tara:strand:+ start:180 stop:941 length:762 start_codon:yes stop_codon:yes gene_type:complete